MNDTSRPILVIGGTGKTGRRVKQRPEALDIRVRVGLRTATSLFDWNDRRSWNAATEGVRAAYYPDIALPGAVDAIEAFTSLAVARHRCAARSLMRSLRPLMGSWMRT